MNQHTLELLRQGLVMTVLGMGLVFAALALLWGLMRLLTAAFCTGAEEAVEVKQAPGSAAQAADNAAASDLPAEDVTAERARVAALVAGALLANALPLMLEPPAGPAFEHGRSAPSWVVGNRALALQVWQPQRKPESYPAPADNY